MIPLLLLGCVTAGELQAPGLAAPGPTAPTPAPSSTPTPPATPTPTPAATPTPAPTPTPEPAIRGASVECVAGELVGSWDVVGSASVALELWPLFAPAEDAGGARCGSQVFLAPCDAGPFVLVVRPDVGDCLELGDRYVAPGCDHRRTFPAPTCDP